MTLWPTPPEPAPALDLGPSPGRWKPLPAGPCPPGGGIPRVLIRSPVPHTLRLARGRGRRARTWARSLGISPPRPVARLGVGGAQQRLEGAGQWADFSSGAACVFDDPRLRVEREPFPRADRLLRPGPLLRSCSSTLTRESLPHPQGDLPGPAARRAPDPHHAERPPGGDPLSYIRGWGSQPPSAGRSPKTLPLLLYTATTASTRPNELVYYLAARARTSTSSGWTTSPTRIASRGPRAPGVLGQRPGRLELWPRRRLRRLVPTTRSQLIARAWRHGAALVPWDALSSVDGGRPFEEDEQPVQGFTRRLTFPFG